MATRIEIKVADAAEGGSVVECLWRRGIPASLLERAGSWAVEVRSAREEQERLLGDVAAALEPWLVATGRAGLALHLGQHHYTLCPGVGLRGTTSGKEPRCASYPNIRGVGLVRERMLSKRSLMMNSISGCVMM